MTELLIRYVFHLDFRSCVLIAAKTSYGRNRVVPGACGLQSESVSAWRLPTESRSRTEQYPFGDHLGTYAVALNIANPRSPTACALIVPRCNGIRSRNAVKTRLPVFPSDEVEGWVILPAGKTRARLPEQPRNVCSEIIFSPIFSDYPPG